MNKIDTVTQWRNYFEEQGDDSTTYKIFIETAYGCHGSCQGCPIPVVLRTSKDPKWDLENLKIQLSEFAKNLLAWRKEKQLKPIENLAITVGPGENLYFSSEYLTELAQISKNFKNSIGAKHFHLAVTTSVLFSEQKLGDKIEAMKTVLDSNELSFAFIINLRQFEKTPAHYYRFAEFLMNHVNLVELEINMDKDISNISHESLVKFSQFVEAFPFIQLDFAYAINDGNVINTHLKNDEFFIFIEKLRHLSNSSMRENFSQWSSKLQPVASDDFDFYGNFQHAYDNITQQSIRLNSLGQWHFTKNILGTIYYDDNLGFSPVATMQENPFSNHNLNQFKQQLSKFFQKQLAKYEPCNDCQWKNTCLHSGFLTYTKFANSMDEKCSNPAFTIFERK
jgi:hypothetical protein